MCSEFKDFRTVQGKDTTMRWQYCTTALLGDTWTRIHKSGSHEQQEIFPEVAAGGHYPEGKKGNGTSKERVIREGVYVCRICHLAARWGISGSESSEGQQQFFFFIDRRLVLSVVRTDIQP